jgi:hypothetical protein
MEGRIPLMRILRRDVWLRRVSRHPESARVGAVRSFGPIWVIAHAACVTQQSQRDGFSGGCASRRSALQHDWSTPCAVGASGAPSPGRGLSHMQSRGRSAAQGRKSSALANGALARSAAMRAISSPVVPADCEICLASEIPRCHLDRVVPKIRRADNTRRVQATDGALRDELRYTGVMFSVPLYDSSKPQSPASGS